MQCMCKDGIIFRVKPVNKADTDVVKRPLINTTYNVTVDYNQRRYVNVCQLAQHDRMFLKENGLHCSNYCTHAHIANPWDAFMVNQEQESCFVESPPFYLEITKIILPPISNT